MTDIQAFEAWAKDKQLEVFWSWEAWKAAIAHERSKAPAWQDAPTVPGLWLSSYSMPFTVTEDTLKQWANVEPGAKWFGPIPKDKP